MKNNMNMISNKDEHMSYIDGCRGIAILIVILSHAGLGKVIPGKFGVTFFFFISGFLITKLLLLEIEKKGRIDIGKFYLRRFFRLYPALVSMILVSLLLGSIIQCPVPGKDIASALFYFTNYYVGWIRPVVPDCLRLLDIIWSLSVEEHFYFFFPFLFSIFLSSSNPKALSAFTILLLILSITALAVRYGLYFSNTGDVSAVAGRIYFSSHTRMDSILWGCLSAIWLFGKGSTFFIPFISRKIVFFSGILLLFLSVAIRQELFRQTLLFSFQGIGLALLVPALHIPAYQAIRRIVESGALIFIGKISYSLYLFHWGISKLGNHFFAEHSWQWQLLFWPLTITCALISYHYVEQPFVALRRRFGSNAIS